MRGLQRVLGKKTMASEILRGAVKVAHKKETDIAIAAAAIGRFPVKAIADALAVSSSNLMERLADERPKRGSYMNSAAAELMPLIREMIDEKPTYGYRRITARLRAG